MDFATQQISPSSPKHQQHHRQHHHNNNQHNPHHHHHSSHRSNVVMSAFAAVALGHHRAPATAQRLVASVTTTASPTTTTTTRFTSTAAAPIIETAKSSSSSAAASLSSMSTNYHHNNNNNNNITGAGASDLWSSSSSWLMFDSAATESRSTHKQHHHSTSSSSFSAPFPSSSSSSSAAHHFHQLLVHHYDDYPSIIGTAIASEGGGGGGGLNFLASSHEHDLGLIKSVPNNNSTPPWFPALFDADPFGQLNGSVVFDPSATDTSSLPDFGLFYRHSLTLTAVYCVAYIFVFIVGLIGNSFVIAVVLRSPRMRTVTNFFIVNLAVADILVIVFCLPATLMSNIFVPWMLGWLMCKTVPYIQGVSVAASVYSLCAVSVDRFLAIWWPLKLQISKRRARLMILCIWVIALASTIPWALFFELVPLFPEAPDVLLCVEVWPPGMNGALYFLLANLVACYVLPMLLITLCYVLIWIKVWKRSIPGDSKDAQMDRMQQKSKIKVVKMLIAVVILFVLSWMPLYYIFARIKLGKVIETGEEEFLQVATPIAQWLGSSNSCINPILYAFFNKKYRRGFAAIMRSRSCCGRLRYYDNVAIASSTTSTRKSSHYHNRKPPYSPSIKSEAVSYIYDQNANNASAIHSKTHATIAKQDSGMSSQMLLKQDSCVSRQFLLKQDSAGSRQLLIKQESSNGSGVSRQDSNASSRDLIFCHQSSLASSTHPFLAKQDSDGTLMEGSIRGSKLLLRQDSRCPSAAGDVKPPDSYISNTEPTYKGNVVVAEVARAPEWPSAATTLVDNLSGRKKLLCRQDSVVSFGEIRRHQLVKQDSVVSFAEPKLEHIRHHQLVKQDSVISFADQRPNGRGFFAKQDSIIQHYPPPSNRCGDGPHVSILKKTCHHRTP